MAITLVDNSAKDGTGDAINGAEVDANPNTIVNVLNGVTATTMNTTSPYALNIYVPEVVDTSAAAGGVRTAIKIRHDPASGTVTAADGPAALFEADDSAGNKTSIGRLANLWVTPTDGATEASKFTFETRIAGALVEVLSLSNTIAIINDPGTDIDLRIESDTNANAFTLDAGLFSGVGAIGMGAAATTAAAVLIDNPAFTAAANTNISKLRIENSAAITVPAGTTTIAASVSIDEPNLTATGTITNAVTLYIEGAPTEGGTTNYALWVDSGAVKFDGALTVDGAVTFTSGTITGITDLVVADGGTGVSTLAANGVLYGAGTSAVLVTAQGGANTVLTANAGAPSFSAAPTIGTSVTTPVVNATASTDSTSASTGAVIVTGGVGIAKALYVGTNIGVGVNPSVKFEINGISNWVGNTTGTVASIVGANSATNNGGNLRVLSNTAQATDIGGSITLGGYDADATAGSVDFAQIAGRKENATSANTNGYLQFCTRSNAAGEVERMRIDSAGLVGIGATANANMTQGLTINQGGADNTIFATKSSDVAHGMTTLGETDTYFEILKLGATAGGGILRGYSSGTGGVYVQSFHTTDNTTQTAAGRGCMVVESDLKSGTTVGACGATANIFCVLNNSNARFLVDGSGNLFADGGSLSTTMVTLYDEYDDVALLSAFDKMLSNEGAKGLIETDFEDFTKYNEKTLIDLNILGGPRVGVDPSQRGLINFTGLAKLHNGAIRQLAQRVTKALTMLEAHTGLRLLEV